MKKLIDIIAEIFFWLTIAIAILSSLYFTFFKGTFEFYFNGLNLVSLFLFILLIQYLRYIHGKKNIKQHFLFYIIGGALTVVWMIGGILLFEILEKEIIHPQRLSFFMGITSVMVLPSLIMILNFRAVNIIQRRNFKKVLDTYRNGAIFSRFGTEEWYEMIEKIEKKEYKTIYKELSPYLEAEMNQTERELQYWKERDQHADHIYNFLSCMKKEK